MMQQQEVQVKESRWVEEIPQRYREEIREKILKVNAIYSLGSSTD